MRLRLLKVTGPSGERGPKVETSGACFPSSTGKQILALRLRSGGRRGCGENRKPATSRTGNHHAERDDYFGGALVRTCARREEVKGDL